MIPPHRAPGFFGKVATHGDFVTRRLPPEFLCAWDRWLQHSLQKSREQLGHAWRDIYLTSPLWRFAVTGSVCGEQMWAGVLMPSVDRVGRHFPLTIASGVPGQGGAIDCLRDAAAWYEDVERLALRTLDKDFSLDAFDVELATLPPLSVCPDAPGIPVPSLVPATRNCVQTACVDASSIRELVKLGPSMTSLWWSSGSDRVAPCVLACEGLPAPSAFSALLDGRWTQRGWQLHRPA